MNKKFIKVTMVLTCAIIVSSFHNVFADSGKYYNISRIYGVNRYETSANISRQFDSKEVKNVILASGKDFPDALAGSVLSKKLNAPILLMDDVNDPSQYDSLSYIESHVSKDGTIYVLGGDASVSPQVISCLNKLNFNNIKRLGGKNRFETNNSIVDEINPSKGTPVVLVNGLNFPDALSISSVAASKGYPIFMSLSNSIPDSIIQKITSINPSKIYIVGGTGVLDSQVEDQLKNAMAYIKSDDLVRISGSNRYETSIKIANYFNLDSKSVILANGENFPDALSGSALASKLNAPIVLTDGVNANVQKKYIDDSKYTSLYILGGQGSVNSSIENSFNGTKLDLDGDFQGNKIIDFKTADVNNDGKPENVILACKGDDLSPILYVQDASDGKVIDSKTIKDFSSGEGDIVLADINGDGTPDITAVVENGGNSYIQTCDIETLKDNKFVELGKYGAENCLNPFPESDLSFNLDGYDTLKMYSKSLDKTCSVDLTGDEGIQNIKKDGESLDLYVGHGPRFTVSDIDGDGVYELKVYEDISGSCHADVIGWAKGSYKYKDSSLKLINIDMGSYYPVK
ncbi:cell wall-binding repeat-containing protein [Clostridium sp. 001]|uniref:cell wall-binding repeat-containing protein n=1 Tax=Clostridium sp. 001 TaxID=1970093 RepID=UPI001C2C5351|nr:cell wall-binding repeat-containing protein [Clostridium sp. 001]QXE17801.1 hypothetical protein B5S50_02475 [Clostridium sp. 001]